MLSTDLDMQSKDTCTNTTSTVFSTLNLLLILLAEARECLAPMPHRHFCDVWH